MSELKEYTLQSCTDLPARHEDEDGNVSILCAGIKVVKAEDYTALRARLAELEIELEECKHQNGISARETELEQQLHAIQATVGDTEFALRSQLATLTIERDRLKEALEYYAQTAISARAIAALRGE